MRWFTVPGWPGQITGHTAATPVPHRLAGSGAQEYKDGVTGRPGTQGIPVRPKAGPTVPGGGADTPSPSVASMGVSRSGDAPDAFYPNQYWARPQAGYWPGAGMPVSYISDNLMPVPATDPRQVNAPLAVPLDARRVQGFTGGGINQPPNLVLWPGINR